MQCEFKRPPTKTLGGRLQDFGPVNSDVICFIQARIYLVFWILKTTRSFTDSNGGMNEIIKK